MIYTVSTKLLEGKGGISTALVGFQQSKHLTRQGIEFVASHEGGKRLSSFTGALFTLARKVQKGDTVWLHCASWLSSSRKLLLALVAKSKGAKLVFHFHAREVIDLLQNPFGRFLVSRVVGLADGIVVLTPWWRNYLTEQFPEAKQKLFVCPNPLEQIFLDAAKKPRSQPDNGETIKLLAMSRLVAGKGFEQVLQAMPKLPQNYRLSIAGDGPLADSLKAQAKALNITDRVDFLGWVNYHKKSQILEEHQLFFLPSRNDSFGMGFVEAMAFGLPVIAMNHQATPDVVPDGRCGILCDNDDPQTLANAVIECAGQAQAMGEAAKAHVLEAFDYEKLGKGLLGFFAKL